MAASLYTVFNFSDICLPVSASFTRNLIKGLCQKFLSLSIVLFSLRVNKTTFHVSLCKDAPSSCIAMKLRIVVVEGSNEPVHVFMGRQSEVRAKKNSTNLIVMVVCCSYLITQLDNNSFSLYRSFYALIHTIFILRLQGMYRAVNRVEFLSSRCL